MRSLDITDLTWWMVRQFGLDPPGHKHKQKLNGRRNRQGQGQSQHKSKRLTWTPNSPTFWAANQEEEEAIRDLMDKDKDKDKKESEPEAGL